MAYLLTVNIAQPQPNPAEALTFTGIAKKPIDAAVAVRAPGPMEGGEGSGVVGDFIGNHRVHGGDDQAVYAYAREDLDHWQTTLNRTLDNGSFGENITTTGLDVTGALIGERWQVGTDGLVLEVAAPRIPCRTFAAHLDERGWTKTFTRAAVPGAYLRVLNPGMMRGADQVVVSERPEHAVTIGLVFRAMTTEPELLATVLDAEALPDHIKERARKRST